MPSSTTFTVKKLTQLVGSTPLISIHQTRYPSVSILAKCEWFNPSGSVKDRAAYFMFKDALDRGELDNKTLIDATSGNTGLAFAMLGAYFRKPVALAMPENASLDRKLLLERYGATMHYTSPLEGTDGAQQYVKSLVEEKPDTYFYPDQYNNACNWQAHVDTTGPEIWNQSSGLVTHFVSGLGTSGTFVGTSHFLKPKGVSCISVQPDNPMHGLEGWKHMDTALTPGIYDPSIADHALTVSTEIAYGYAVAAFSYLGLALSPSSAANLVAAMQVASTIEKGVVVTIFPDNASKYLQESFWNNDDYTIRNPFK